MKNFKFIPALLVVTLLACNKNSDQENLKVTTAEKSIETSKNPSFQNVESSTSGITFVNAITHDLSSKFNLFDYDYFYNGSGVGVEDLNNDGLMDIVFCGNQVENRIYLNKGDLTFEDITTTSGINVVDKKWSSGVTFVDITQQNNIYPANMMGCI